MTENEATDESGPQTISHGGTTASAPASKKADAGWDLRVRETVNAPRDLIWTYLIGPALPLWLGQVELPQRKGENYTTRDGVSGTVLGYKNASRVQVTWRPDDWPHDTTLQLSLRDGVDGTTIVIHHEGLLDREERRMMLGHWKTVIAQLAAGAASQQLR